MASESKFKVKEIQYPVRPSLLKGTFCVPSCARKAEGQERGEQAPNGLFYMKINLIKGSTLLMDTSPRDPLRFLGIQFQHGDSWENTGIQMCALQSI